MVARDALEHGWAGIVVWGCVRDTDVLQTLDLGVMALAPMPRR
jgi:regulator of ribonuclease activity A